MERCSNPTPINPNAKYLSNSISNVLCSIQKCDQGTLAWPTVPRKRCKDNNKMSRSLPRVPIAGSRSSMIPNSRSSKSKYCAGADKKNTFYQILQASQDQPSVEKTARRRRIACKCKCNLIDLKLMYAIYNNICDTVRTYLQFKRDPQPEVSQLQRTDPPQVLPPVKEIYKVRPRDPETTTQHKHTKGDKSKTKPSEDKSPIEEFYRPRGKTNKHRARHGSEFKPATTEPTKKEDKIIVPGVSEQVVKERIQDGSKKKSNIKETNKLQQKSQTDKRSARMIYKNKKSLNSQVPGSKTSIVKPSRKEPGISKEKIQDDLKKRAKIHRRPRLKNHQDNFQETTKLQHKSTEDKPSARMISKAKKSLNTKVPVSDTHLAERKNHQHSKGNSGEKRAEVKSSRPKGPSKQKEIPEVIIPAISTESMNTIFSKRVIHQMRKIRENATKASEDIRKKSFKSIKDHIIEAPPLLPSGLDLKMSEVFGQTVTEPMEDVIEPPISTKKLSIPNTDLETPTKAKRVEQKMKAKPGSSRKDRKLQKKSFKASKDHIIEAPSTIPSGLDIKMREEFKQTEPIEEVIQKPPITRKKILIQKHNTETPTKATRFEREMKAKPASSPKDRKLSSKAENTGKSGTKRSHRIKLKKVHYTEWSKDASRTTLRPSHKPSNKISDISRIPSKVAMLRQTRPTLDKGASRKSSTLDRRASRKSSINSIPSYMEKLWKIKQYLDDYSLGDDEMVEIGSLDLGGIRESDLLLYPYDDIYNNISIAEDKKTGVVNEKKMMYPYEDICNKSSIAEDKKKGVVNKKKMMYPYDDNKSSIAELKDNNVSNKGKKSKRMLKKPKKQEPPEIKKNEEEPLKKNSTCCMCKAIKSPGKDPPFLAEMRKEQKRQELMAYRASMWNETRKRLNPARQLGIPDLDKKLYCLVDKDITFTRPKKSNSPIFPTSSKTNTSVKRCNSFAFPKESSLITCS